MKETEKLVCKSCAALIPNCLSCTKSTDCDLCRSGYVRAEIVDAFGVTNRLCIREFCGFYGEGNNCLGKV